MNPSMIKELAARFFNDTVALRQHLHQHPELSFMEHQTAQFVSDKLSQYGIRHQTGVGGTGILAWIEGQNPMEKCIALRAELDALPLDEKQGKSYCSVNKGVMHACGHDAHMAMLLTAARILQQMRPHFDGTIKLLFQPAEEKIPGGALAMIEAGCLENPVPSVILAQHVLPTLESGKVGFRPGPFMASGDEINIVVRGKGGHAALPDKITDTVLTTAQIVVNLQQISSRFADPFTPTVLSFGKIIANGAHNVIPDVVLVQGTFRTFSETWRKKAKQLIVRIAEETAAASGATAEVNIDDGYPILLNDESSTKRASHSAIEYLGNENVVQLDQRMTTEDFAWYSHQIPAVFYRIGTGNTGGEAVAALHTSGFDIDETMLENGSGLMAWIALTQLNNNE